MCCFWLLGLPGCACSCVSAVQEPEREHSVPRVSPYRLAAHLASAFTIFALLAWTTMSLAFPVGSAAVAELSPAATTALSSLRLRAHPLAALIGLTALSGAALHPAAAPPVSQPRVRPVPPSQQVSAAHGRRSAGAFVAGNDAGHAYNDFPLMNGRWLPEDYFELAGWRNAFESTAAVQLHHRCLPPAAVICTALQRCPGSLCGSRPARLPSCLCRAQPPVPQLSMPQAAGADHAAVGWRFVANPARGRHAPPAQGAQAAAAWPSGRDLPAGALAPPAAA